MKHPPKPNSGALFINRRKESDTHADFSGSANVTCPHCQQETEFYMDAWGKRSENGNDWQSFKFKAKAQPSRQTGDAPSKPPYEKPRLRRTASEEGPF